MKTTLLFVALLLATISCNPFPNANDFWKSHTCSEADQYSHEFHDGCWIYGSHHIHTFDGLLYHPQMVGDFVIAKDYDADWQIQARYEWCPGHEEQKACLTGVSWNDGSNTLAFYYDITSNFMALTKDGVLQEALSSMTFGPSEISIQRRQPELGWYISIETSDFNAILRLDQKGPSLFIYVDNNNDVAGLCGLRDECQEYELVRENTGEPVGWEIAVSSYAVWGQSSLFETQDLDPEEFPFIHHAPIVPYLWIPDDLPEWTQLESKIEYCKPFGSGALFNSCLIEEKIYGDHLSMLSALFEICRGTGTSRNAGYLSDFSDLRYNCSLISDYQMEALESIEWDYHDVFDPDFEMAVSLTGNQEEVMIYAPLGGEYLFGVKASDCCSESSESLVLLEVECEKGFEISTCDNFVVDLDEFSTPEVQVFAELDGVDQYDDDIHISWKFLDCPNCDPSDIETINDVGWGNRYSLIPVFMPSYGAGVYIMEVIATDGCSISRDFLNVTVNCINRVWEFTSYTGWFDYDDDAQQYDGYYGTLEWNNKYYDFADDTSETYNNMFSWGHLQVSASCLTPWPMDLVSLVSMDLTENNDILSWIEIWNADNYSLSYTVDKEWVLGWVIDDPIDTIPEWKVDPTSTNNTNTDDYDGIERTFLDEHWYQTSRFEYKYKIQQIEVQEETVTKDLEVKRTAESKECLFFYYDESDNYDIKNWFAAIPFHHISETDIFTPDSPEFDWVQEDYPELAALAELNEYFIIGSCEGLYHIKATYQDSNSCPGNFGVDEFDFDVTCSRKPRAHTLTPCFDFYFDYNSSSFPDVVLYGWDSDAVKPTGYDAVRVSPVDGVYMTDNRLLHYEPGSSNPDNEITLGDQLQYNWSPGDSEARGTHTFTLLVTDDCRRDSDSFDVSLQCRGEVVSDVRAVPFWPYYDTATPNTVDFDYEDPTKTFTWAYTYNDSYTTVDTQYWPNVEVDAFTNSLDFWLNFDHDDINNNFTITLDSGWTDTNSDSERTFSHSIGLTDGCDVEIGSTITYTVRCTYTISVDAEKMPGVLKYNPLVPNAPDDGWPSFDFVDSSESSNTSDTAPLVGYSWVKSWGGGSKSYSVADPTMEFNEAGNYTIYHSVKDDCRWSDQVNLGSFDVQCGNNTISPYFFANNSKNSIKLEDRSTDYIVYNATDSSLGSVGDTKVPMDNARYTWECDESNNGEWINRCSTEQGVNDECFKFNYGDEPICDFYIPSGASDPTTYRVYLRLGDGCKIASTSHDVTTSCEANVNAIASPSSQTVTFEYGTFDKVCVNGQDSTLGNLDWTQFSFQWEVLSAPVGSLFEPTVETSSSSSSDDVVVGDWEPCSSLSGIDNPEWEQQGYYCRVNTTTDSVTSTETTTTIFLKNLDDNIVEDRYGVCFRPDLPGDYSLQLYLSSETYTFSCYESLSDPITVTAACNNAPSASISAPSEVIVGERAVFDGSASTSGDDTDELTYVWTILKSNSSDVTEKFYITNSHGSIASWIPRELGTYTLTLVVDDGCQFDETSATVSVVCPGGDFVPPEIDDQEYEFDGIGSMPMTLSIPPAENGTLIRYTWTLKNFTYFEAPEPESSFEPSSSSGVSSLFPQLSLIVLFSILLSLI